MADTTEAKTVTRVNITDSVQLRRIEIARQKLSDSTATKTAQRLIDAQLAAMGIPLLPEAEPSLATA